MFDEEKKRGTAEHVEKRESRNRLEILIRSYTLLWSASDKVYQMAREQRKLERYA